MKKFNLQMVVPDSPIEPPRISIVGDVEKGDWIDPFMRGIAETIDMLKQMYGPEAVEKALNR